MSLLPSGAIESAGYDINNSLRFRSSATAYLSRTFSTTGTNNKIQTFSAWIKRGLLSSSANYRLMGCYNGSSSYSTEINFSNDFLRIEFGGSSQYELKTTQVFRDPSAWYHIVVAIDTTQATASNRIKMYVNGSQITAFATANYPAQNDTSQLTSANANNKIGANWSNSEPFDGYMAEVNFIDGQALTPSSFGETDAITGVWKAKKYTGTYGTNGFYLKFSDIATTSGSNAGLGKDFSGNSNYWTTNNISVTAGTTYDAMLDVPTNTSATVANYSVINPVNISGMTLSEANLKVSQTATAQGCRNTIAMTSGKWYWEVTNATGNSFDTIGIVRDTTSLTTDLTAAGSNAISYYANNGNKYINGTGSSYGATYTTNDIIGVAVDIDNNTVTFYKNGTSQGAITGLSLSGFTWYAANGNANNGINTKVYNFGQRAFSYSAPSGYVALNTFNLPTPTILQGNKYMDATLYTGNTTTVTATNGGAFKPDLVWIKDRSAVAQHVLTDSVRGTSAQLFSSLTNAEQSNSTYVTSFNTNGFTVGVGNSGTGVVNNSGDAFVGWQWQAGQGTNTTNTSGTITSTVSVNASAGFSIATYTGSGSNATVGHGLGVAPKMVIVKNRSAGAGNGIWRVYHTSLGGTQYINLNETTAATTGSTVWNNTNPTSSVFSVGITGSVNDSGNNYVAYCWAEIAGFSKFGSYVGNGSTDGPFVFTGFRPKYVLLKSTGVENWFVFDSSRNTYNVTTARLYPSLSNAEDTNLNTLDLLSNGFKFRDTNVAWNGSGTTYIYMAFAENPFRNSLAR